jgi:UDP-N-acetyl-D-glucosamine dehydrogenase
MPEYVLERIGRLLNTKHKSINGSKIVVIGVAYKKNISDVRESPALDCIRLLQDHGAKVSYCDPYVPVIRMEPNDMKAAKLTTKLLHSADLVAILTDHSDYDYQMVVDSSRLIFDTRNATKSAKRTRGKVERL